MQSTTIQIKSTGMLKASSLVIHAVLPITSDKEKDSIKTPGVFTHFVDQAHLVGDKTHSCHVPHAQMQATYSDTHLNRHRRLKLDV